MPEPAEPATPVVRSEVPKSGHERPDPVAVAPADARPGVGEPEATALPADAGLEEYLPRAALSVTPQPIGEVLLAYPPQAPIGLFRGVLTLFIDQHGGVQRVRIESGDAEFPPVFQEAARQSFLAARFEPGQLQGRPVKSRIRIAVEFEASATSRDTGSQ